MKATLVDNSCLEAHVTYVSYAAFSFMDLLILYVVFRWKRKVKHVAEKRLSRDALLAVLGSSAPRPKRAASFLTLVGAFFGLSIIDGIIRVVFATLDFATAERFRPIQYFMDVLVASSASVIYSFVILHWVTIGSAILPFLSRRKMIKRLKKFLIAAVMCLFCMATVIAVTASAHVMDKDPVYYSLAGSLYYACMVSLFGVLRFLSGRYVLSNAKSSDVEMAQVLRASQRHSQSLGNGSIVHGSNSTEVAAQPQYVSVSKVLQKSRFNLVFLLLAGSDTAGVLFLLIVIILYFAQAAPTSILCTMYPIFFLVFDSAPLLFVSGWLVYLETRVAKPAKNYFLPSTEPAAEESEAYSPPAFASSEDKSSLMQDQTPEEDLVSQ
jgi:hypothetical protein